MKRLSNIPSADRTPEWRKHHTFKAKREIIEKLKEDAKDKTVFLCGVTANDADELWDLFDKVFALVITDEKVLRERILNRDEDGYGKNPHEFAKLLEWQKMAGEDYQKLGATLIDAMQPIEAAVDEILRQSGVAHD